MWVYKHVPVKICIYYTNVSSLLNVYDHCQVELLLLSTRLFKKGRGGTHTHTHTHTFAHTHTHTYAHTHTHICTRTHTHSTALGWKQLQQETVWCCRRCRVRPRGRPTSPTHIMATFHLLLWALHRPPLDACHTCPLAVLPLGYGTRWQTVWRPWFIIC